MNITEKVIQCLPNDLAKMVTDNPEIQVYLPNNSKYYIWRDGRFKQYSDQFDNLWFEDFDALITHLKMHLRNSLLLKKEVSAILDIKLNVECPSCENDIDLLTPEHDDDNQFTRSIFDDWNISQTIECDNCKSKFTITKIER